MGKNSIIPTDGRIIWSGVFVVALFVLAAGCQPPPDEKSEDTAARLKRLETRMAALELNSDVYNERNKKFERFMEESERQHSELLVRMSKLHENPQRNAPATGTVPAAGVTEPEPAPAVNTGKVSTAAETARYHLVQKSDTIYSISRQYNLEPAALKKMNNLTEDVIVPGQKLRVK